MMMMAVPRRTTLKQVLSPTAIILTIKKEDKNKSTTHVFLLTLASRDECYVYRPQVANFGKHWKVA